MYGELTIIKWELKDKMGLVESWVQIYSAFIFVLGLLLGFLAKNSISAYIIVLIAGIILGRTLFLMRRSPAFVYYFMGVSFIIGFLIGGVLMGVGNYIAIILVYYVSAIVSYKINKHV